MLKFLKANSTKDDVVKCLKLILEGRDYVWSDFTDVPIRDHDLDLIRLRVLALEKSHPPGAADYYLNPEGQKIVRAIVQELESGTGTDRA
jgi:hypothetical protein